MRSSYGIPKWRHTPPRVFVRVLLWFFFFNWPPAVSRTPHCLPGCTLDGNKGALFFFFFWPSGLESRAVFHLFFFSEVETCAIKGNVTVSLMSGGRHVERWCPHDRDSWSSRLTTTETWFEKKNGNRTLITPTKSPILDTSRLWKTVFETQS